MMEQRIAQAKWEINRLEETAKLAAGIAELAGPGTVIALDGDLGAGKTTFSQAFAGAIGVEGIVNSPTFTIIKEYEGRAMPFYHMDVYRLSQDEADDLGLDEYFYGNGVTLVEWASLIPELMPPNRLELYIENLGGESRTVLAKGFGEPYAAWCEQWDKMGAT